MQESDESESLPELPSGLFDNLFTLPPTSTNAVSLTTNSSTMPVSSSTSYDVNSMVSNFRS